MRNSIQCILTALLMMGCASNAERYNVLDGIGARIDPVETKESTAELDEALKFFYQRAGLGEAPSRNNADWDEVIYAGFDYIDERCEVYVDALHWYNRAQSAAIKEVSIVASVTSTLVALTGGGEVTLGILAAAFGLVSETIDNTSSALLYQMDPSAVGAVIDGSRSAFEAALLESDRLSKFRSKVKATRLIRRYLSLCLPAGIERQINQTLTKQNFEGLTGPDGVIPTVVPVGTSETGRLQAERALEQSRAERARARADFDGVNAAQRRRISAQADELRVMNNRLQAEQARLEQEQRADRISRIQAALCVSETGEVNNSTQTALNEYRAGLQDARTGWVSVREQGFLLGAGSCAVSGYLSAFERGAFGLGTTQNGSVARDIARDTGIRTLQLVMRKVTGDDTLVLTSPQITGAMRGDIQAKRTALGVTDGTDGSITNSFFKRVLQ